MGRRTSSSSSSESSAPRKGRGGIARPLSVAAGILAGAVGLGLVLYAVTLPSASDLLAGCPAGGATIALVVGETSNDDRPIHTASYAVFDALTGRVLANESIDSSITVVGQSLCVAADATRHWVVALDGKPVLRSNSSESVVAEWLAVARAASLSGEPRSLGWDVDGSRLAVNMPDGRSYALTSQPLGAAPIEGTPRLSSLGAFHDEVVPPGVVDYYLGGLDSLRLADGVRLRLEGHPRSKVVHDGTVLFGGRDFLSPDFVVHPGTGSIEWPEPASVVVVEETEVGSLRYRATRIALDGRVLWSFTPEEPSVASWRYRPTPWAAYAGGRMLVLFEAHRLRGVDPRSGVVRWTTEYAAEPGE